MERREERKQKKKAREEDIDNGLVTKRSRAK